MFNELFSLIRLLRMDLSSVSLPSRWTITRIFGLSASIIPPADALMWSIHPWIIIQTTPEATVVTFICKCHSRMRSLLEFSYSNYRHSQRSVINDKFILILLISMYSRYYYGIESCSYVTMLCLMPESALDVFRAKLPGCSNSETE